MKTPAARAIGLEGAYRDDPMAMHEDIEQCTEAMDEGDSAHGRGGTCPGTALSQAVLHRAEKDLQRQGLRSRIVFPEVPHAVRPRQHPLAHGSVRNDVIDLMGGRLDHGSGIARGVHAAPLAGA